MAVTTFRSEVSEGTGFEESITWAMIADDTSVALYGPVVLADGSITELPHAASTTNAGDAAVIGVCVALPESGSITADTSFVQVCIHGRCKVRVHDTNVSLNDPLQTYSSAGLAAVQADPTVDPSSAATVAADVVIVANNIRKCFAIALSTVSSGADSYVACFVNINTCRGNVT